MKQSNNRFSLNSALTSQSYHHGNVLLRQTRHLSDFSHWFLFSRLLRVNKVDKEMKCWWVKVWPICRGSLSLVLHWTAVSLGCNQLCPFVRLLAMSRLYALQQLPIHVSRAARPPGTVHKGFTLLYFVRYFALFCTPMHACVRLCTPMLYIVRLCTPVYAYALFCVPIALLFTRRFCSALMRLCSQVTRDVLLYFVRL